MDYIIINLLIALLIGLCAPILYWRMWIIPWIKVKMSGGSKVMVCVQNPLSNYFRVGKFDNGFLYFTARKREDNNKPTRMIAIQDISNIVYSQWGVKCIDVDDMKNCIMVRKNASYESVNGFNAEAVDEAMKTALMKPSLATGLFDEKTWQIICLGIAALVCIGLVILYQRVGTVDSHVELTYNAVQQLINITTVA